MARVTQFLLAYKVPLVVVAVVLVAVGIEARWRLADQDFYARGLAEMNQARYDAAISSFNKALRQNPADPAARFGLGWAYHRKGLLDEALKQYAIAGQSASSTAGFLYFNMGVILQQQGKLADAVSAYQSALAANPASAGALHNLGLVYLDTGQNELALQQFGRLIQLEPQNASAIYYAGLASERLGRRDEARKHYESVLALDPRHAWAADRLKALGR